MVGNEEIPLIAPCGIYCGGCPLYLATSDDEWRRKIARARGVSEDKLALCAGCRPLKGNAPGCGEAVCATYICATAKGVKFCYECPDFPCLKLAPCADRAQEIPHNMKIYNLLLMKKDGPATFTRKYRERVRQYLHGKKSKAGCDIQL
jgi:hypothetical protein